MSALRRMMPGHAIALCAALLLAACASTSPSSDGTKPEALDLAPERFGARPDIPTPAEVHHLNADQREAFDDYLESSAPEGLGRHRQVSDYLQVVTENFHYQGETLTAADALAMRSGNCLSLAILTTALARQAGVEVGYQLADDLPVFEFNGDVVKKGVHVRTVLYDPEWQAREEELTLRRPGVRVDYFSSALGGRYIGNLDASEYMAMYYRNVATKAFEEGDYTTAYWYAVESLRFALDQSDALNLLALINRRTGDLTKAEEIYLYGLERAGDKLTLLKNYRALLLLSGRQEEAREVERRLARMDDPSPFSWLQLARSAQQEGDYPQAIVFYRRALEIAPYLHEGHLALAQAYYHAGRRRRALASLNDALENTQRTSTRELYQAKVEAFRSEL